MTDSKKVELENNFNLQKYSQQCLAVLCFFLIKKIIVDFFYTIMNRDCGLHKFVFRIRVIIIIVFIFRMITSICV